jgi:hypothetical protein
VAKFTLLSATLFVSAVAMIPASTCSAAEPVIKWRAEPNLEIVKSSTNCGHQYKEPIGLEFDGKTLKTSAWSRMTYDMILLAPLNADGSGEVDALSMPLHRSMVVRFAPGHGPRNVTFWGRYYSGTGVAARCVYTFVPLEGSR